MTRGRGCAFVVGCPTTKYYPCPDANNSKAAHVKARQNWSGEHSYMDIPPFITCTHAEYGSRWQKTDDKVHNHAAHRSAAHGWRQLPIRLATYHLPSFFFPWRKMA